MGLSRARHVAVSTIAATVTCVLVAALDARTSPGEVGVSGRRNANPSIAAAGRFVALAWGASANDGVTDIFVATSRDAGGSFGAATRANDDRTRANLSGEQPPRVTLIPRAGLDPSIVVVWTVKESAGTRLVASRSDDGGRTYGRPTAVPGSVAAGNRGWESIATDRDGHVVAVWLDHRELATSTGSSSTGHQANAEHAGHSGHGGTDGAARANLSKLMFGGLDDRASVRALTGGVCYCCKTAIATDADGSIYAAWRHVYPGNIRDIAFTTSRDGGRTFTAPARVSEDKWALDGCPENGPSIAVDEQRRIHIVWPTLIPGAKPDAEGTPALFYAMSRDGRTFTPRRRLPTEGVPWHPQVVVGPGGTIVVAWDEQARGSRRVALARGRVDSDGVAFERQALGDDGAGSYPVLATASGGLLMAWTRGTATQSSVAVRLVPQAP